MHWHYTMVDTATALRDMSGRTIILTGALKPRCPINESNAACVLRGFRGRFPGNPVGQPLPNQLSARLISRLA